MPVTLVLRQQTFTLEDHITVQQALERLNLAPESYLVLVNGILVAADKILEPNEYVELIPTIAGG
jgi:sulfur carrier protein ThiS